MTKKVKIPGIVWIIVGLFITIISALVSLKIFIIIGVLFISRGILKLIMDFAMKNSKSEKKLEKMKNAVNEGVEFSKQDYCPRCKTKIKKEYKNCRICGQKLK